MDEITDPWYSLSWFSPSTLQGFTWENAPFLYAILAVPLIFIARWFFRHYFNQKLPVALVKSDLKNSPLTWIRIIPELILAVVLALILTGLARPQKTNEKVKYEGFMIPPDFVVGYGLDAAEDYRGLSYLAAYLDE